MNALNEARENLSYWTEQYDADLEKGRDRFAFGMLFMANQIKVWGEEVNGLEQSH